MMNLLTFFTVIFIGLDAGAEKKFIAVVIDSGFSPIDSSVPICKSGLFDLTGHKDTSDADKGKHGTNIASLIAREVGPVKGYCIVVLKIFTRVNGALHFDSNAYVKALRIVKTLRPSIVNLSIVGYNPLRNVTTLTPDLEVAYIKDILDSGVTIVAAAGNDGMDFNKEGCKARPACVDPRIIVVGNSGSSRSNIGREVDVWEDGQDKTAGGVTLSGTSQAAAIYTGKVVKAAIEKKGAQ